MAEEKQELTEIEKEAIQQFDEKMKKIGGRYETGLIRQSEWINHCLKSNRVIADKRLESTERKLLKDATLRKLYEKQIQELITHGRAVKIVEATEPIYHSVWYLPHNAVIKMNRATKKVQIVFDVLSKGPEGVSLNDTLLHP